MIGLMKDEKDGKIIAKFEASALKSYSYCVQEDAHETEDSKTRRKSAKGVKKKSVSKELGLSDYEKFVFNSINSYHKRTSKL